MESDAAEARGAPLVIGRYALFDQLASGGMATVHLGRRLGEGARTVAIKRLHAHLLEDEEFVSMFMDEGRIVSRIPKHPNVVSMLDLVRTKEGIFLVIDYVQGESLARLVRDARKAAEPIPTGVVTSILCDILHGLHVAHETKGRDGENLGIVHRDISPHNVMIGADGVARVLDFGIAKAAGRSQRTREGQIKGKFAYMAPEQIRGEVDRRADIFAAGVVLWEMLAGRRMYDTTKEIDIVSQLVKGKIDPPSKHVPSISRQVDAIVLAATTLEPKKRYPTALALAADLERCLPRAPYAEVAAWVERFASEVLTARAERAAEIAAFAEALEADEFVVIEERVRRPFASSTDLSRDVHLDSEDLEPEPDSEALIEAQVEALIPLRARPAPLSSSAIPSVPPSAPDPMPSAPTPSAPTPSAPTPSAPRPSGPRPPPLRGARPAAAAAPAPLDVLQRLRALRRVREHELFVPIVLIAFFAGAAIAIVLGAVSIHSRSSEEPARLLGEPSARP